MDNKHLHQRQLTADTQLATCRSEHEQSGDADIDYLRESPGLAIIKQIAALLLGLVIAVKAIIKKSPRRLASNLSFISMKNSLTEAKVIVLLVNQKHEQEGNQHQALGQYPGNDKVVMKQC